MSLNGIILGLLFVCSFGKLRRFNAEFLGPCFCRLILKFIGIRLIVTNPEKLPQNLHFAKVMYIFNHNSFLDIFIIQSLGLKKTRPIISTRTRKILPLFFSTFAIGSHYIPFKDQPVERLNFFKKLTLWIKNNPSENLICAPEGVHTFKYEISKFNKGIFHTALLSKIPICPIFFDIPKESNPLESYFYKSGVVKITVMDIIETKTWCEEKLSKHIEEVRNIFVNKNDEINHV